MKQHSENTLALLFTILVGLLALAFGSVWTDVQYAQDVAVDGSDNAASILTAAEYLTNTVETYHSSSNVKQHTNEYWDYRFSYDFDLYPELNILGSVGQKTVDDFIDKVTAEMQAATNRADRRLTDKDIAVAKQLGTEQYNSYVARAESQRAAAAQEFGITDELLQPTFFYKIIPKSGSLQSIINKGVLNQSTALNNANSYYNRYGESQSSMVIPAREVVTYEWFYDSDLGAVLIAWCIPGTNCLDGYSLENTIELFPRNRNENGYYVYENPISNHSRSAISSCVSLPEVLLCFGGSDQQSVRRAVSSVGQVDEG